MKTYQTNDGEQFTVENSRDLVKQLRAASRDPEPNIEAFMRALAKRVRQTTSTKVPTNSDSDFVAALLRSGLLTEIEGTSND